MALPRARDAAAHAHAHAHARPDWTLPPPILALSPSCLSPCPWYTWQAEHVAGEDVPAGWGKALGSARTLEESMASMTSLSQLLAAIGHKQDQQAQLAMTKVRSNGPTALERAPSAPSRPLRHTKANACPCPHPVALLPLPEGPLCAMLPCFGCL